MGPNRRVSWRPFVSHWNKRIGWWWWWRHMTVLRTWVLDGTHQTSTLSPSTFRHLFHRGTNTCIPVQKKSVSSVCSKVTACYASTSVANHLPVKCTMRGPQRWKSLGARTRLKEGWSITSPPQHSNHPPVRLPVWGPASSNYFDTIRSNWLTSDLH